MNFHDGLRTLVVRNNVDIYISSHQSSCRGKKRNDERTRFFSGPDLIPDRIDRIPLCERTTSQEIVSTIRQSIPLIYARQIRQHGIPFLLVATWISKWTTHI